MKPIYIVILIILSTVFNANAQKGKNKNVTDIDEQETMIETQMRQLEKYYNSGRYSNALKIAKQINNSNVKLDPETNQLFLKYYICSLKEMSYDEEADSATIEFTKKYPFYKPTKFDQPVFKDLLSNFYTRPRLAIWISGGVPSPIIQVDTVHLVGDTTQIMPDYSQTKGTSAEIALQFFPFKYFSVALGLHYMYFEYTRDRQQNITTFSYNEKNHRLSVPLYFIATMPTQEGKWVSELMLGAQADYLLKTTYTASTKYNQNQHFASSGNTELIEKNKINYTANAGIRLNYNHKQLSFFIDNTFRYTIKPFNNSEYNLNNNDLVYNQLFVPDAIHLITYTMQIGIKISFGYTTFTKYGYGYAR